jgi:hypothetical protein
MQLNPRVVELLADIEAARAAGRPLTPEAACADCPELLDALRAGAALLAGFDAETVATNDQTAPFEPAPNEPPRPHGHARYCFGTFLARGGMGEVWSGTDLRLGKAVALKVLQRGVFVTDDLPRLQQEARLGARLEHPGIAPVYDLDTLPDGRPFLVMKLVEGQTLGELLARRASPLDEPDRWLGVFAQICAAVAHAHALGILHRDLKPSNVLIDAHDRVQVVDWGIAKMLDGEDDAPGEGASGAAEAVSSLQSGTRTGTIKGTAAFMAPEQALGQHTRIGPGSDVFGLGGILCVLLTGRPTYQGKGRGELLDLAQRADLGETLARLDRSGADREAVALARWCLMPNPEERPGDAAAVGRAVQDYQTLRQLRASLPPAGPLARVVQALPYWGTVVLALLPHALGAALVTAYCLLWSAAYWPEAYRAVGLLLAGYTTVALLTTGCAAALLTWPYLRVLARLRRGDLVPEAEVAAARAKALRLHAWALVLSALGWLPGGLLVPWLLEVSVGGAQGMLVPHFLLAFTVVGLMALTYCTLATDFLVFRIAYPWLWSLPRDVAATVRRELASVAARFRLLPLLATVVPLTASLAFLLDATPALTAEGRLFRGLAVLLVVLGMVGAFIAGAIANYLRRVVEGFLAAVGGARP